MAHTPYAQLIDIKRWADRGLYEAVGQNSDRLSKVDTFLMLRVLDHIHTVDRIFQHHLQRLPHNFTAPRSETMPELQVLADELGIEITVCHTPPGTSKWNKIEHRLFSFITQNWRVKPLISYLVIVQLIASTTTDTGLTVACRLDDSDYAKGIKVTDAEMAALNIQPADFHGEWNYTIAPRWPDG